MSADFTPEQVAKIPVICQMYGFTEEEFIDMFQPAQWNGIFIVKQKQTFSFLHARKTTGDKAIELFTEKQGKAGDLWERCTGMSIREFNCAARNCPKSDELHGAKVTAHVYSTTQKSNHPIEYMILIPTCSKSNNIGNTQKNQTCYPVTDEVGHPLVSYDNGTVQLMFIKISETTAQGKGAAGKGTGKGGTISEFPYQRPK